MEETVDESVEAIQASTGSLDSEPVEGEPGFASGVPGRDVGREAGLLGRFSSSHTRSDWSATCVPSRMVDEALLVGGVGAVKLIGAAEGGREDISKSPYRAGTWRKRVPLRRVVPSSPRSPASCFLQASLSD
jgi:hypothetical protein